MGKIDKITPFVSKTMVDFVENGITAATETPAPSDSAQ